MKKIYLVFLCLFFIAKSAYCNESDVFINPGIKLGYQLGANGGFVYGFEVSLTSFNSGYPILGVVSNIDFCKGNTKLHFGAEVSTGIIGVDFGPTLYFTEKDTDYGLTLGGYSLAFLIPYCETTIIFNNRSSFFLSQFGFYIKHHLRVYDGNYDFFAVQEIP